MPWLILVVAGIFEVLWASGLKYSDGFTKLLPSVFTVITLVLSFVMLSMAMKNLPLGTAYTVWTGIGAAGTIVAGIFVFNEPYDFGRIACLGMIIAGVVGLKILS
ncbi:MAG: quaternary ammonium compound efflux SMR transporter SugE [Erysipelotrichia bacterium]|nr:quaternary ammonium compound efflux SMR transporter SugE [Erysipelotrichia bacterium]